MNLANVSRYYVLATYSMRYNFFLLHAYEKLFAELDDDGRAKHVDELRLEVERLNSLIAMCDVHLQTENSVHYQTVRRNYVASRNLVVMQLEHLRRQERLSRAASRRASRDVDVQNT